MINEQEAFRRLTQSIQLLAAEYDVQINVLPDIVHKPDEVALVFDECMLFVKQLEESGFINELQRMDLNRLDTALEGMSQQKGFWTLEAMQNHPRWEDIRLLARNLLSLFSLAQTKPDLYWIKFVA